MKTRRISAPKVSCTYTWEQGKPYVDLVATLRGKRFGFRVQANNGSLSRAEFDKTVRRARSALMKQVLVMQATGKLDPESAFAAVTPAQLNLIRPYLDTSLSRV